MKYAILGVATLLILGGCVGEPTPPPPPKPKPIVKKVEQPKPVYKAPLAKGEVPPLPEREVDVDMDDMVDQAATEVIS